ncbi:MAG: response regulator transcription factor [Propionibacteriales bacterium]|nr:response regulator transcription factor [Propionibacteriales bacterium]
MRVLVVEDEAALADSLAIGRGAEGYVVDVARDGWYGHRLATDGSYGLIVLDLMLPGMSGHQVCRELRTAGVATPILVLTARDGVEDHTEALDCGADDYLTKPFSFPVLLAHLRALDRRRTAMLEPSPTVGDLVLDGRNRRCLRAGRSIPLTDRELALLDILVRHAGVTVGKDELLLAVWPEDAEDPNLVEARVSALRRKIDAPFGRHSLQTIRGEGYRLIDDRS